MNIAEACIKKATVTVSLAAAMLLAGILGYFNLGRLEDPEFTNTLVIAKGAQAAEPSPKVHSFRQDGSTASDGSRLLMFDIEYRCRPRVFEKPSPPADAGKPAEAGNAKGGAKK